MTVSQRNNVHVSGQGLKTVLFAHGFGCDQHMWRFVTPAFEQDYRLVLFDHVGAGQSDITASGEGDDLAQGVAPLQAARHTYARRRVRIVLDRLLNPRRDLFAEISMRML